MSDDPSQQDAPHLTPSADSMTPEDLERLLASAGMVPPPSKSALRRKILITAVIAGVGVGASVMSCVGQSFSYRQAHALEGIEEQLKEIRASCPAFTPAPAPRAAEH